MSNTTDPSVPQHTPGPWHKAHVVLNDITKRFDQGQMDRYVETASKMILAGNKPICRVRNKNDASLVAVAPELLAALESLIRYYSSLSALEGYTEESTEGVLAHARAAIAKAKNIT